MVNIGKMNGAINTLNSLSLKIVHSRTIEAYRKIVFDASKIYQSVKADIEVGGCPGQAGDNLKKALTYFQGEADKTYDRLTGHPYGYD